MAQHKLVIAEKPSVAQSLAAVIGATVRKDGYLEGNGWRVSWCVGHLAGLADADSYDPKYAKWRYGDLPILPEHWQMVVGKDKKKQFDILKKLMNAPDVTEVVNACDAGREGEMIFRSVYELAGCKKPMKRLWISSMEDSAIREGFANLRPGADYDGLRDAALCRAKADWLVGINATRLFSVLYHRTLNIGRVMSPTLALIVQREAEIDTFQPIPFYTVALELPGLTVSGERMADKVAAEQLKEACQGANVTIKKVECKEKSEKPPALYDLTTLQRDANRLLGFTAQQTLDYLQSLYEKKLCTYPRTDSRYLTGDMADSLPVLVNLVANAMPFRKGIAITCDPQTVINDKKVTDHHAVIPTRNLKDADLSALPAGEKAVLELVTLRLLCAVKSHDISIDRSNYDLIYTAPLRESGTVPEQLEKLYEQFNLQKPADFHSPSMSVSDIVAIKQDGKVSCHYCDSVGFTKIPGFLPENPLKNAEMAVEDDYGMIDGIINNGAKEPTVAELEQQARSGQSISLMDLAAAAHREEREKKKSVMEQLKSQPKAEHKKTAPKKSAEREI